MSDFLSKKIHIKKSLNSVIRVVQGGFYLFPCKISKFKKKKYQNSVPTSRLEMAKYGKSQNIGTIPHCEGRNSLDTLNVFFLCFNQDGNS